MSVLWGYMDLQTARRILCVLIIVHGGICVLSKRDRLLHYCRSSVDFYQKHTAGCNVKYLSEVMLTLAMSFLYGAKDKIDSSIKLRLFCTIMVRLFTHYRKSQHLKKVFVYFKKRFFFVCDICSCGISYGVLAKAGHTNFKFGGDRELEKVISPLPVLHSPVWVTDRANYM